MYQFRTDLIFMILFLLLSSGAMAKDMSNADLKGIYYTVQALGSTNSADGLQTVFSELTFDGTKTVARKELHSSLDEILPAAETNLEYSVAADGKLAVNGAMVGAVSPSGDYLMFSEMPAPGGEAVAPFISLGIKSSAGLSESDLSGTYSMLSFGKYKDEWFSNPMAFTADGKGAFTAFDELGRKFTGEYTVNPTTGRVQLVNAMEGFWFDGVLSSDGTVFSGIDTDPSDNQVFVLGGFKTGSNLTLSDIDGTYYLNTFGFCSEHGHEAFHEKITIDNGEFEGIELNNTIDAELDQFWGYLKETGQNQFLLIFSEEEQQYVWGYYTVFSPNGELFAMSDNFGTGEAFLTLGIAGSEPGGSDSSSDSGCFIQTLIK